MSLHGDRRQARLRQGRRHHRPVILDRQLQETIYQFEHAPGVVARIDRTAPSSRPRSRATSADRHHDAPEVPVHPRQLGDLPGRPLRGHRGRGALIPGRRGRQGRFQALGAAARELRGQTRRRGRGRRRDRSTAKFRPSSRPGRRRAAAQPLVLCLHGHPHRRRWSCSGGTTREGQRAVPPVLDASGDRGGLHPRRARALHALSVLWQVASKSAGDQEVEKSKATQAIVRYVTRHPETLDEKAQLSSMRVAPESTGWRRPWL